MRKSQLFRNTVIFTSTKYRLFASSSSKFSKVQNIFNKEQLTVYAPFRLTIPRHISTTLTDIYYKDRSISSYFRSRVRGADSDSHRAGSNTAIGYGRSRPYCPVGRGDRERDALTLQKTGRPSVRPESRMSTGLSWAAEREA